MRHLSAVTVALVATAIYNPSPASAQACVQGQHGRVICDPVVTRYPGGWYYEQPYPDPAWPVGYCPPGTVAGNFLCIPWRAPRGSKCPPNMMLVDGFCRLYSDHY
jgi:hypothetical protein